MKTLAVSSLIFTCFIFALGQHQGAPGAQTGACGNPADDRAIGAIGQAWKDGYNRGEAARVASLYSPDAYYLTQHFVEGVVHPRPMIQAYVQRGVDAHYQVDSIETLFTSCSGELAYAITRYHSSNAGQAAMGVNLVVLRKIDGKWLIVAHESAVPDPATSIQSLDPAPK